MEDIITNEAGSKKLDLNAFLSKSQTPKRLMVIIITLALLLCAVSVIAWVLYKENIQSDTALRIGDKETIITSVANHVLLPTGEEPVFATVTDPEKLSDQPFFQFALKGDKVLIYSSTKKAILYRPSIDRIIEMIPFDPSANSAPL